MGAKTGILILLFSLFLIGAVGAVGVPDTITVTTNKLWTIANNADQSTISVTVMNTTPGFTGAVPGATVTLAVDPAYGYMNPATVTTDPSGKAASTFRTWNRSGTAEITATVQDTAASGSVFQNIDHDTLVPVFSPKTGTVGEIISFSVSIADPWGNPIDTRRGEDNTVSLTVSCPMPNDCEFVGYGHSYSASPGPDGNLTVPLRLGTKTGYTAVVMSPVQNLGQQEFFIDTQPSDMTISPHIAPGIVPPYSIPTVPVNSGLFTFTFTLSDTYDNPVANMPIKIRTSLNEEMVVYTNAIGKTPSLTYGPKNIVGTVDITAEVMNSSETTQFTVAFTTAEPKDMMLVATPQVMGSLDYEPAAQADVIVRVLDNFGNPISGHNINLTLDYTAGANWSSSPSLAASSGVTNADGEVKTVFRPGGFNTTKSAEGFCLLTATWVSNPSYPPKTVNLTWSNRPYLSIVAGVNPQNVKVNETVDVTIRISVNGKKGIYHPLTVMLDQDNSGSMSNPSDVHGVTRQEASSAAGVAFINKLDPTLTQMGLETFPVEQNKPSYGHLPVPTELSVVGDTLLNKLKPSASSGDMGNSIGISFNQIISATSTPAHKDDIKVLILLSDGGSNLDSDLPAIISTANANKIYVFTISYLSGGPGDTKLAYDQMEQLAKGTGGSHYAATSAGDLANIYNDIYEKIKKLADENTAMTVSFQNIKIDNTMVGGSLVYDYIPVGPFVPLQTSISPAGRTSIIWPNGTQTVMDQSLEWPDLKFNVGTIDIGQNWSTTFRLKVKQPGTYNVFGSGSRVVFGGGASSAALPDLPITVLPDLADNGIKTGTLAVWDLHNTTAPSSYDQFSDFIPLQWNTKYESKTSSNIVKEYAYYRINGGSWKQFDFRTVSVGESTQTVTLDVRTLPSGTYDIKVEGYPNAKDSNDATSNILTLVVGRKSASPYLNLT